MGVTVDNPVHTEEEQAFLLHDYSDDSSTIVEKDPDVAAPPSRRRRMDLVLDVVARILIRLRPNSQSTLRTRVISCLLFIIPSFLRFDLPRSDRKLAPTAHLDGLRGLAALFVFFFHSSYGIFLVRPGFGTRDGHGRYESLLRLPFIRLLFSGDSMVAIFFVISGFVLSIKPVKQMRNGDMDKLLATISSSGFRRGFRLFIPCFASTFIVLIALRLGLFEGTRAFSEDRSMLRGTPEGHPMRFTYFGHQFYIWFYEMVNFVHPWEWENIYAGSTHYDVHLWTIPVEFRCSMVLFMTQVCVARMYSGMRLFSFGFLVFFAILWGRWEMMLFWAGGALAEIDLVRQDLEAAFSASKTPPTLRRGMHTAIFILGLYFLSYPDNYPERTFGFHFLWSLVPRQFGQNNRFWQAIGATMIAYASNCETILQKPFNTRLVQYFGQISYSLYLMHGLVIHTLGYTLWPYFWSITGRRSDFQIGLGFLCGEIFVIIATIWAADIFWRAVDSPSNKFCRWLEGLFVPGVSR